MQKKPRKHLPDRSWKAKKLGVIGLGAIGVLVANAATHLGMDVYGYDPYVSVDSAWRLSRSIHHTTNVDEIYENCDYITVHVPALDSTKGMIGKDALGLMKEGVIVLNFARDVLVDSEAMVDALVAGKSKTLCHRLPDTGNRRCQRRDCNSSSRSFYRRVRR